MVESDTDRWKGALYIAVMVLALIANGPEYFLSGQPISLLIGGILILGLAAVVVSQLRENRLVIAFVFVALFVVIGHLLLTAQTLVELVLYGGVLIIGLAGIANHYIPDRIIETGTN